MQRPPGKEVVRYSYVYPFFGSGWLSVFEYFLDKPRYTGISI